MSSVALYSLPVVAVVVLVGGIFGFVKAQSKASLIAGTISALFLVLAFVVAMNSLRLGLSLGALIDALLIIVFSLRLKKTGKFMPAGAMLIICGIDLILMLISLFMPA